MGNRFKPVLNRKAEIILSGEKRQERLHEKYKEVDQSTVIVENNAVHTAFHILGKTVRILAEILLFLLAVTGLAALVFPEPRGELYLILQETADQVRTYLGR